MGFDAAKAKQAFVATQGNVDDAIAFLLSGDVEGSDTCEDETKERTHYSEDNIDMKKPGGLRGTATNSPMRARRMQCDPGDEKPTPPTARHETRNAAERSEYTSAMALVGPGGLSRNAEFISAREEPPIYEAQAEQTRYPGAVAIEGPGGPRHNADYMSVMSEGPTVYEAHIVEDDMPDREVILNRLQQLEEQLQAERNQEVVPSELVVPDTNDVGGRTKCFRRWAIIAAVVVIVGVAVGATLGMLPTGGEENRDGDTVSPTTHSPPAPTQQITTPRPAPETTPTPTFEPTTNTPTPQTTPSPTFEPPSDQDFFDPDTVTVGEQLPDGRWPIEHNNGRIMTFINETKANFAVSVIQHYGMNSVVYVGRPDPSYWFFLVNGQAPVGSIDGEDCLYYDRWELYIQYEEDEGHYSMTNGWSLLYAFPNLEEAEEALAYVNRYEFDYHCYVERGRYGMNYGRR